MSDSKSPYVKEKTAMPKPRATATTTEATNTLNAKPIVVREEKVTVVDNGYSDKTDYNFYVIIGSFRIIDNAKNYKNQLIEESFKPVILANENGLYRVSVGSGNDEAAVRAKIADIRSRFAQYSDVWLLVRTK